MWHGKAEFGAELVHRLRPCLPPQSSPLGVPYIAPVPITPPDGATGTTPASTPRATGASPQTVRFTGRPDVSMGVHEDGPLVASARFRDSLVRPSLLYATVRRPLAPASLARTQKPRSGAWATNQVDQSWVEVQRSEPSPHHSTASWGSTP